MPMNREGVEWIFLGLKWNRKGVTLDGLLLKYDFLRLKLDKETRLLGLGGLVFDLVRRLFCKELLNCHFMLGRCDRTRLAFDWKWVMFLIWWG